MQPPEFVQDNYIRIVKIQTGSPGHLNSFHSPRLHMSDRVIVPRRGILSDE